MGVKKDVFMTVRIPCGFYPNGGTTLEHCEKCSFFNGVEKDGSGHVKSVDCLKSDIPSLNCHVTEFEMNGEKYRVREYDREIEGDEYDYCQKCCFNKKLVNGHETCLLRSGVDECVECFCCNEGEIWEKVVEN